MTYRVEISAQVEHDADAILEWLRSQHRAEASITVFGADDNLKRFWKNATAT